MTARSGRPAPLGVGRFHFLMDPCFGSGDFGMRPEYFLDAEGLFRGCRGVSSPAKGEEDADNFPKNGKS